MRKLCLFVLLSAFFAVSFAFAQSWSGGTSDSISLPTPAKSGGMSLNEALAARRSVRDFAKAPLSQQEISQLLWATQGITDEKGHRTAPSARAKYFLSVYVATADGFFQYVPEGHRLKKLGSADVRSKLSTQPSVLAAPAVFVVAGDYDRAQESADPEMAARFVNLEAGHATQNLLLQATALKLGAVPVGGINPGDITKAASLPSSSRPIYLVPVGHTK